MKIFNFCKKKIRRYILKFIVPPAKAKNVDLLKIDANTYKLAVRREVYKIIAIQYLIPLLIIIVLGLYATYFYLMEFINWLGGI